VRTFKPNKKSFWIATLLCLSILLFGQGCESSPEIKRQQKPSLGLTDIKKPPKPADGKVRVIQLSRLTTDQRQLFERLGIVNGIDRVYVMTPSKAMNAAELRSWADSAYIDAKFNNRLARTQLQTIWSNLQESEVRRKKLIQSKQSWWNQNKTEIGFFTGFALGSVSAILIVHGIDR
jgi:DNA-binding cell septation regulator SpoVG